LEYTRSGASDRARPLGEVAAKAALDDAGVGLADVDCFFVANVGSEMAKGQKYPGAPWGERVSP